MTAEIEGVVRYLHGEAFERSIRPLAPWNPQPFVTISRQAGAGGRTLAEALLKELESRTGNSALRGWRIFDRELCEAVAKDLNIQIALNSLIREEFRGALEDVIFKMVSGEASQAHAYGRIFRLILGLASVGKAIVIGRGGACLTRRFPQGIHLRLVASRAFRIERVAERFRLGAAEAARWVDEQDAHRAKLVRSYFREDIDDPLGYDAVWNTESVPPETLAAALADMIERKAGRLGVLTAAAA